MDAQRFGGFVADCRREKGMTQAGLAEALHVTDKAVSRWERGVGFPDISTLEPLAEALGVSILELMKSERITADDLTKQEAAEIVSDALRTVSPQKDPARRAVLRLPVRIFGAVLLLFLALVPAAWLCLAAELAFLEDGQYHLAFEAFALFRRWILLPAASLGVGLWMRRKNHALLAANEPLRWRLIAALLAGTFLLLAAFQSGFAGNAYGTLRGLLYLNDWPEINPLLIVALWEELATTRLLWCGFIAEAAVFLPPVKCKRRGSSAGPEPSG